MDINGKIILAYSLTPIHAGMGRSPGAVDLPVQRDNVGYPIIYGSSIKGALKSYYYIKNIKNAANNNNKDNNNNNNPQKNWKCMFGSEPEEPLEESEIGASNLIFTDMIPFIYPIATQEGYAYISTEYLISRVNDILEAFKNATITYDNKKKEINLLLGSQESIGLLNLEDNSDKNSGDTIKDLRNNIKELGQLIKNYNDNVYIFDNSVGLELVEYSLIRYTRNVLDKETKKSKNLWNEEYIPHGTIFIGGVTERYKVENCGLDSFSGFFDGKTIFFGGKETIGKGLVKLKII